MKINLKVKHIKIIILCSFLLTVFAAFSQDNKEDAVLDSLTKQLFKATNNKDYETLVNLTYPKIFDIFPKKTMVNFLKITLEGNADYKIELNKLEDDYKISKIYKDSIQKTTYAFLSYDLPMSMIFVEAYDDDAKKLMIEIMETQGIKATFVSNHKVNILKKNSIVLFIKDEATNGEWYMLNFNADSPMLSRFLPADVIKSAQNYYNDLMLQTNQETKNE